VKPVNLCQDIPVFIDLDISSYNLFSVQNAEYECINSSAVSMTTLCRFSQWSIFLFFGKDLLKNSVLGKTYELQRDAIRERRKVPHALALAKYYSSDQTKDYETDGACDLYRVVENFKQGF
jgi:hypothetical protein